MIPKQQTMEMELPAYAGLYDVASSSGLIGMEMQGALAIFTVNLKRILKVKN